MRIALHQPQELPLSLRRYLEGLLPALRGAGVEWIPYTSSEERLSGPIDLLWDPCCGLSAGPVWPKNALPAQRRCITFHGAAALALAPREFWGDLDTAIEKEAEVQQALTHWLRVLVSIDLVIVPSSYARWEMQRYLGMAPAQVVVLAHGVDPSIFHPAVVPQPRHGLLHVCSWQPKKNLQRVLAAYAALPARGRPPLRVLSAEPLPEALCREAPAGVQWEPGPHSPQALANAYREAEMLIFPSLHETFGLPVLEAMACACPVLTANNTALVEVFGDASVQVEARDVAAISAAIQQLREDGQLCADLVLAGLRFARRQSWVAVAERYAAVLQRQFQRPPAPFWSAPRSHARRPHRRVLLILGMHRSGTSLLSGLLQIMGLEFGDDLLPAQTDNAKGFFEDRELVALHERMLTRLHRQWDDPLPLGEEQYQELLGSELYGELLTLLRQRLARFPTWSVKDPRLCLLLPVWEFALRALQVEMQTFWVLRHPLEVVKSLCRRNGMAAARGERLWLLYNLQVADWLQQSGLPVPILHYDDLLRDPVAITRRLRDELPESLLHPELVITEEIASFVDPRMRHSHRHDLAELGDPRVVRMWQLCTQDLDHADLLAEMSLAYRELRAQEAPLTDACTDALGSRNTALTLVHGQFASYVDHTRSELARLRALLAERRVNPAASASQDRLPATDGEKFYAKMPRPTNVLGLYASQWVTVDLPGAERFCQTPGNFFAEPRVDWVIEQVGGSIHAWRVLELGPLEGRQSYHLHAAGASEVLAIEGNIQIYPRLLALLSAFSLRRVRPLLGDFTLYLQEQAANADGEHFDLIFACGVLYHLRDPVAVLSDAARVGRRLYLWTHYYDRLHLAAIPGWQGRMEEMRWQWREQWLEGALQSYNDSQRSEFCGGFEHQSVWLTKDSLLRVLEMLGYRILAQREGLDHPHGPVIELVAVIDSRIH